MLLKNKEIVIRTFVEGDIENKVQWINNPENNEFLHYDIPLNYEKTLEWYKTKNNTVRCDCVIEYDGLPVGLIGLFEINQYHKKAEFYISMGNTNFKRKGIATISSKLILEYAFTELMLNKVYLNVDSENIIACKLYEKIGFVCEGEFIEDMFHRGKFINRKRYAMLSSQFFNWGSV